MAEPLRRTLLAKLRGKKPKKGIITTTAPATTLTAATANGSRDEREREKEKVAQSSSPGGKRDERDVVVLEEREPNGHVDTATLESDKVPVPVCSSSSSVPVSVSVRSEILVDGRVEMSGFLSEGEEKLSEYRRLVVAVPRRHTDGDSILFGNRENAPFQGEVLRKNGRNVGNGKELERRRIVGDLSATSTGSGSDEVNFISSRLTGTCTHPEPNHIFCYIRRNSEENGLIQTGKSSLQCCGDVKMPTFPSPTYFPTELDLDDVDVNSPLVSARAGSSELIRTVESSLELCGDFRMHMIPKLDIVDAKVDGTSRLVGDGGGSNRLFRKMESTLQYCEQYKTQTFPSPTFFPTKLDIVEANVDVTSHFVGTSEESNKLIQPVESTLEYCEQYMMPTLPIPTFFPTDLGIVDADVMGKGSHDLIRAVESSLEFHSDIKASTFPSPTFFPTELDIVDADMDAVVNTTEGPNRPNSVDSEDDDYYDNEILPFYKSQNMVLNEDKDETDGLHSGLDGSAQETDRLRSQLKEAYHLLINAMQDIAFDGQIHTIESLGPSGSSSQSADSVSACSSSTQLPESDAWSSGENVRLLGLEESSGVGRRCSRRSRSLQSLTSGQGRPSLRRSISDGGVHYLSGYICDELDRYASEPSAADMLLVPEPAIRCALLPEETDTTDGEAAVLENCRETYCANELPDSPEAPSGKPELSDPQQLSRGTCSSGVTVNKMQEWMHKGRVLSSEMRQRIAGSSGKASDNHGNCHIEKTGKNGPQQVLTDSSGVSCVDSASHPPALNSITVSKKRNWLHQSSTRPTCPTLAPCSDEELGPTHSAPGPTPISEMPRPLLAPLPHLAADLAEENDADDEGEIWYNPIPEDEEAELHHHRHHRHHQQQQTEEGKGGGGDGGNEQKQTFRTQEELTISRTAINEANEPNFPGFSPPSSPNPAKKSCSISWSLPDRIKSPRTVRKLSIKMKKIPELSRKLSIKGNQVCATTTNGPSELKPHPGMSEVVTAPSRLSPVGASTTASSSGNVIWRYHLDSSVSTQQPSYGKKKGDGTGVPKSASKGGYLSDGDSPELVAKSAKHGMSDGKSRRARDKDGGAPKAPGTELDVDAFRPYTFSEQPKCLAYISGLMSLHFYGAEDLKPPRVDSRDVYCAIQVDSVNKARTALLTCRTAFLDMDHTFNIELENAQHLKLVVFSWEATPRRNRVCCHGTVALPPLFRVTRTHQLAVRLEPRGMIYVKLGLMERWQNSLDGHDAERDREGQVFGVEAARVVEREGAGLDMPLLVEKCIAEIERRGCQVVGLYRLCGSAAVKKELREAFERDSHAVELSESNYPDINVITGVLKDYLRELPFPLISKSLYESVLDSMTKRPLQMSNSGGCENHQSDSDHAVGLLDILSQVHKAMLRRLLDHLKRVASHHQLNKMTCQNLAVCFGPVLLSQRQDASSHGNRIFLDSEELASALHFKKHIEVLHYLLQLWPVVDAQGKSPSPGPNPSPDLPPAKTETAPVRRRKERPQVLNLSEVALAGVLRPRPGRLDSPSNRYAGDWSDCREAYLQETRPEEDEADYADVPGDDRASEMGEEELGEDRKSDEVDERMENWVPEVEKEDAESDGEPKEESSINRAEGTPPEVVAVSVPASYERILEVEEQEHHSTKEHTYQAYMKFQEISPVLSNRVNLRDLQENIDALICNLERELNKNKLNVGY